jgi:hypothetical protein
MSTYTAQIMDKRKVDASLQLDDIFGATTVRRLPAMPAKVRLIATNMTVALELTGEREMIFRQSPTREPGWYYKAANAVRLREAFLAADTPEAALRFLEAVGQRFRYLKDRSDIADPLLSWNEFQLWQRLIGIVLVDGDLYLGSLESPEQYPYAWREARSGDEGLGLDVVGVVKELPEDLQRIVLNVQEQTFHWLQGQPTSLQIQFEKKATDPSRRPAMFAEVTVDSVLDAILAGVYMDTREGIQYELCALKSCSKVFEVKTKHGKEYCTQAHAHEASVRRRRGENPKREGR